MTRSRIARIGLVLLASAMLPAAGFAQGSGIAGVARDATGAVLPGVTVEAASPALIEKSRTVITDAQGQYKIVDLPPGAYTVTFTGSSSTAPGTAGRGWSPSRSTARFRRSPPKDSSGWRRGRRGREDRTMS